MTVTAANVASFDGTNTITEAFALEQYKSISTVGINYAGGNQRYNLSEKAKVHGDNSIAKNQWRYHQLFFVYSYKDNALTTIGASGLLGSGNAKCR